LLFWRYKILRENNILVYFSYSGLAYLYKLASDLLKMNKETIQRYQYSLEKSAIDNKNLREQLAQKEAEIEKINELGNGKIMMELEKEAIKLQSRYGIEINTSYLLEAIYYLVKHNDGFDAAIQNLEYLYSIKQDLDRETL
jgi:radical SAM superfamily enzyme YgiQ (UPF0313 family)